MNFIKHLKKLTIALIIGHYIGAVSNVALALESDANQPIYIESNSATYDDAKGVSTYLGDVEVIQGSMKMNADELIIYIYKGNINKLIAKGSPVRFRQTPEPGKEEIKGKSLRAEYYPNKGQFILLKEAVVWQGKNTYASEIIEYDVKNAFVKAGEQSTDRKRVTVVLQPKSK